MTYLPSHVIFKRTARKWVIELWLYLDNTKLVQILHDARALEAARVGVWVGVRPVVARVSAGLLLLLET